MTLAKILGAQPAFPSAERNSDGSHYMDHYGLTKREWIAAKALEGLAGVPCPGGHTDESVRHDVETAVVMADALLAELAKDGAA